MEKNVKLYKTLFLEKAILGRTTDLENPDEVILKCIKLAYRDMLTAGRYYVISDAENNIESRCNQLKSILEQKDYVYSRNIIEQTQSLFGDKEEIRKELGDRFATRFGLAQKLVNMTYKYFYVFYDYIQKDIDFSKCDCPLDSIIIKEKLNLKQYTWSKLTNKEYLDCQQKISGRLQKEDLNVELKSLGNLAFDFLNW